MKDGSDGTINNSAYEAAGSVKASEYFKSPAKYLLNWIRNVAIRKTLGLLTIKYLTNFAAADEEDILSVF